jgi:hypothetical protein
MWGRLTAIHHPAPYFCLAILLFMLASCGVASNESIAPAPVRETPSETNPVPAAPEAPTLPATTQPTSTPSQTKIPSLWISPALPNEFAANIALPEGWTGAANTESANIRLAIGSGHVVSRFIYALVAPFPTITDEVPGDVLKNMWAGKGNGPISGNPPLLMDANTRDVIAAWWGTPAETAVRIVKSDQLAETAWQSRPSWAIVPFDQLEPRWKVLSVDGNSPIHNNFEIDRYALSVPISLQLEANLPQNVESTLRFPATNRDSKKLTTLIMTGVTAMVRGTAALMDTKGVLYPGEEIADTLRSADLTHISNEVPFASNCPPPNPFSLSFILCSNPDYIRLMDFMGTDIVELTGNHFQDFGSQATLDTIDTYIKRGWGYFGGGKNFEDARKPLRIENHGNRLAFIGCNPVGPDYAWATPYQPGAAPCDDERYRHDQPLNEYTSNYAYLEAQVRQLKADGYLPIVTFQYREYGYYPPETYQQIVFQRMADAGAIIVSGSQSHHPQDIVVNSTHFIHYGLGNLFFDQIILGPEYENAFIDRHVFYNGKYLGTELLPIRFEDQARSRFMTSEERVPFLTTVFCSSGWNEYCPPVIAPWQQTATPPN